MNCESRNIAAADLEAFIARAMVAVGIAGGEARGAGYVIHLPLNQENPQW